MTDLLLMTTQDFGGWSSDPARPDYACPAYREMALRWQLVHDVRGGTVEMRAKKEVYLPKFEAETIADWTGRVSMTFANDHYDLTLTEHVGLVFASPIVLCDDVPAAIVELVEDIDGEGNHLDVFAQSSFDSGLDLGHGAFLTEYPVTNAVKNLDDKRRAKVRPYVVFYSADDILSPETAVVGGVLVLSKVTLKESATEGANARTRYREISQEVFYDQITGRATGLGAITWRTYEKTETKDATAAAFTETGNGTIVGPPRIPLRAFYGGQKLGLFYSKPHLFGLAMSNLEETQVQSDYAAVMHKCNVPTPIFIGRNQTDGTTVQMGQGIDMQVGGDAKFLEPSGVALASTRTRLEDIRAQMRRQGATSADPTGKTLTATEASLVAKQKNAKLLRAARSLQDAIEGVFADMAAFMGIATTGAVKSGGSVTVNQDYSGASIDTAYLTVLATAYGQGAIPLDAYLYALQHGKLPDDFSSEDAALRLLAEDAAAVKRAADEEAKRVADAKALADKTGAPPAIPAAA